MSASTKGSIYILSIFCRYTNYDYIKLRMVRKIWLVYIRSVTRGFGKNRKHLICAPGSSFTHMIDIISVYPK
jgi:hypothetical protein